MSRKSSQVEKPDHVTLSTSGALVLLFLDHISLVFKAAESGATPPDSFSLKYWRTCLSFWTGYWKIISNLVFRFGTVDVFQ